MAKKTKTTTKKKPERKVNTTATEMSKAKDFRKNLKLDYDTARLVNERKNSVSFYVTDDNSGDEVLCCENIDSLDKIHDGLREKLDV